MRKRNDPPLGIKIKHFFKTLIVKIFSFLKKTKDFFVDPTSEENYPPLHNLPTTPQKQSKMEVKVEDKAEKVSLKTSINSRHKEDARKVVKSSKSYITTNAKHSVRTSVKKESIGAHSRALSD